MNRFKDAVFHISVYEYEIAEIVLEWLKKGTTVVIDSDLKRAVEDFPDLKITVK